MLEQINIDEIKKIAMEAGSAIMEIYKQDFSLEYKEDESPLTQADLKANEIICTALEKLNLKLKMEHLTFNPIPIMSEENKQTPYEERKNWDLYWCIDPIDGTKEFIKKNDEFTVNIALIHKNSPVLGVVYAPALHELYYAQKGQGAFRAILNAECLIINEEKLPIIQKKDIQNSINIVASKSHLSQETQEFINNLTLNIQHSKLVSKGSSLKLCMVATGEADIYPRLSPTMEWDTAAADAIVREAGKMTYQYDNKVLATDFLSTINHRLKTMVYNKEELLNPWFVVV
ncbi:MAG: 3'(2'),5'-bisphosphate nucleotidase CysQ [Arcobacteraceae bacterium]